MKTNVTPKEWGFSLFFNTKKGLNNTTPLQTIDLNRLFEIYTSDYLEKSSNNILRAKTPEEKTYLKSFLPYITPTGVFSYRRNENIEVYNSTLLPLDIDGLEPQLAIEVQKHLSTQRGCVFCSLSPRGEGVKAIFYLGGELEAENHYTTLTNNREKIAKSLLLTIPFNKIDVAQNKLCQPFFLSHHPEAFFNLFALPTLWTLENVPKKIVEYTPPTITNRTPTSTLEEKRLYAYINSLCTKDELFFSSVQKGERHGNIWRVGGVSSIIHYAPHLKEEMRGRLENAIRKMYASEEEFISSRGKKTFDDIWNKAIDKRNIILEDIINEYKALER